MKAVIFNSGLGKRMGDLTKNNPKCMVRLSNGESIFERQIRLLSEEGIKDFESGNVCSLEDAYLEVEKILAD